MPEIVAQKWRFRSFSRIARYSQAYQPRVSRLNTCARTNRLFQLANFSRGRKPLVPAYRSVWPEIKFPNTILACPAGELRHGECSLVSCPPPFRRPRNGRRKIGGWKVDPLLRSEHQKGEVPAAGDNFSAAPHFNGLRRKAEPASERLRAAQTFNNFGCGSHA